MFISVLYRKISLVLVCIALAGCSVGGEVSDHGEGLPKDWPTTKALSRLAANVTKTIDAAVKLDRPDPTQSPAGNPIGSGDGQPADLIRSMPIETFLLGLPELPSRLKATSLLLQFRSNDPEATFEVRYASGEAWQVCPEIVASSPAAVQGNSSAGARARHKICRLRFERLKHGLVLSAWVRARGRDGRVDQNPLQLGTLIDLESGTTLANAMAEAREENQTMSADRLPVEVETGADGQTLASAERRLLVGSFYAVTVPPKMYTATYSTTKTYNNSLHILRAVGRLAGGAYDTERCDRDYERVVDGPKALEYCEATPTREQLGTDYPRPMPYNHVEIVTAKDFGEKILVAAFDQDRDPYEQRLGIDHMCGQTPARGALAVPVLNEFFGVAPARELLQWCQIRSTDGHFWWIGMIAAELSDGTDRPANGKARLKVVYSVRADRGILSGNHFASRVAEVLTKVVVPIAAIPE